MDNNKKLNDNSEKSIIQVAFALTDLNGTFSRWVGSAMLSILKNTKATICFHILLDKSVSRENQENLRKTVEVGENQIRFHLMDATNFPTDNQWMKRYTVGSLYRLALPEILTNVQKVIYLDADLIFNRDIKELWDIDISNYCIAAAPDVGFRPGFAKPSIIIDGTVSEERYFNSGVMVMNLRKIRAEGGLLNRGLLFLEKHPESFLPDQDALNFLFQTQLLLLDRTWNCATIFERLKTQKLRPVVYHFQGQRQPWFDNLADFDKLLMEIQADSEWGYSSIENDLVRGFGMMSFKIEQLQKLISKLSNTGIKRIYYGPDTNGMRNLLKMVPPRTVDYCIGDPSVEKDGMRYGVPVRDFNELGHEWKNSFVVFVLPEADGGKALQKLDTIGLRYGEDYFVIPTLLKTDQGGYIC